MNSSNADPLPTQPAIVAPFPSPVSPYSKQAALAPLFPLKILAAAPSHHDHIPDPPSAPEQEPDPDWSVSKLPKRPPFTQRLPDNITLLKVATDFGLDPRSFNGTSYRCPFHNDNKPSLKLNQADSKNGWFYCFGCKATGNLVHWVAIRTNLSRLKAYMTIRNFYALGPDELLPFAKLQPPRGKVRIGGMRTPTLAELETIAQSGYWDLSALRILAAHNLLTFVKRYSGCLAYALRDPLDRVAILRRFDGGLWKGEHKAILAPGSNLGVPIGVHQIDAFDYLALTEGGPDYFRLGSLITQAGHTNWLLPLMMPSAAATRINPALINSFANKRIRIFAHNDASGIAAAKAWKDQLSAARAEVDVWIPPQIALSDSEPTSDLQDLYFKLSPQIRAGLKELTDLLNFHVTLFEPRV